MHILIATKIEGTAWRGVFLLSFPTETDTRLPPLYQQLVLSASLAKSGPTLPDIYWLSIFSISLIMGIFVYRNQVFNP